MTNSRPTRGQGLLENFLARWRYHVAQRLLPTSLRTGNILDIGCGQSAAFLHTINFAGKFGIDTILTPTDINRATQDGITLTNIPPNTTQLPFPDNHFQAVTMLAVFEHIPPTQLPPLLKEIHRVIAPQGILVITTPAPPADKILRVMARLHLVSPEEIQEHHRPLSTPQIQTLLTTANFQPKNQTLTTFQLHLNRSIKAKK
ncbi:MAG: class I SAM-dependent methyltransferase [Sedimentisphaerales bacterium]|nr:class I SAM-dependent methyltransferase [Sedimentisphaerales bacterium]